MSADGPLVGILVGSESDRERMQPAVDELEQRGVAHEFEVRSAHRTPDAVAEYARSARDRGLRVLICGSGLAAAQWRKGSTALLISESSLAPGDYPRLTQPAVAPPSC